MKNIKNITDNELLFLVEENDETAFGILIERYTPAILTIVNKYKNQALGLGLEISDLYQEGLIGLVNAVKSYSDNKEAAFKTYANIIIERQILDLVKVNSRTKYKSLNTAISLDTFTLEEQQGLYNLVEKNTFTPEVKVIDEESRKELRSKLTEIELKVYELKVEGKSNKLIAEVLERSPRSIENTVQRIKYKLRKDVEKD